MPTATKVPGARRNDVCSRAKNLVTERGEPVKLYMELLVINRLADRATAMGKIFFYGLFMDRRLLIEKGFHPETIGPAVLSGYRIHIGERATLLPSASGRAYGILMELSERETHALYSEPSVREYQPERVQVTLSAGDRVVEAYCYNLPRELGLTGANPAYANELARLVEALEFDSAYAQEIAAFGERS